MCLATLAFCRAISNYPLLGQSHGYICLTLMEFLFWRLWPCQWQKWIILLTTISAMYLRWAGRLYPMEWEILVLPFVLYQSLDFSLLGSSLPFRWGYIFALILGAGGFGLQESKDTWLSLLSSLWLLLHPGSCHISLRHSLERGRETSKAVF